MSEILKINYTLELLSLEHIAIVKVATMLWNEQDIKDLMSRFSISLPVTREVKEEWLKIEDRVKEKALLLPLPERLKEKTLDFTKPIGIEIFKWIKYHGNPSYLGISLPQEFCWTSHGTIDRQKTAEYLVKDDNLDILVRYKLSCIYCLENAVQELWTEMQLDCRRCFDRAGGLNLVTFWTSHMKGELDNYTRMIQHSPIMCTSPYQYAFECLAADDDNTVAAEYFFKKLTPAQKNTSLQRSSDFVACKILNYLHVENYCSDFLCFLLLKMNGVQQKEFFAKYSYCVLCFIDWPWQTYFMKTAVLALNFIDSRYFKVLENIIMKIREGHKYFDYRNLFMEFWEQSPTALKTRNVLALSNVLQMLFQIGDESIIRLIFEDLTPQDKDHILNIGGETICRDLILREDWVLLEYFHRECIISENRFIDFKECFKTKYDELKRLALGYNSDVNKSHLNYLSIAGFPLPKLFCLLEDILCEFERKGYEKTGTHYAKRLRKTDFN